MSDPSPSPPPPSGDPRSKKLLKRIKKQLIADGGDSKTVKAVRDDDGTLEFPAGASLETVSKTLFAPLSEESPATAELKQHFVDLQSSDARKGYRALLKQFSMDEERTGVPTPAHLVELAGFWYMRGENPARRLLKTVEVVAPFSDPNLRKLGIRCAVCGNCADFHCTRCDSRADMYCGKPCQAKHWPMHKLHCTPKAVVV